MKLDKRHLIVSVALLVGSIIYNVWVFTRPSSATVAGNAADAAAADIIAGAPSAPPSGTSASAAVDPAQVKRLPDVELDRLPEWPRDPFADQRSQPVLVEVTAAPVALEAPDPVVASILYSADRRLATLDGRIVRVGDRIGNATVIEILPSAVIIESPERGRRTLTMRPPGSGFTQQ